MKRIDRKFTVVLINVGMDSVFKDKLRERYNYPPYGLLSIASVLRSHGYEVHLIDLMISPISKEEFIEELLSLQRNVIAVGICTYTETIHLALEVSRISKQFIPEAKIILGGVHASFCPEEVLENLSVDYVVRGEGESTIIALLELIKYEKYVNKEKIYGISYKENSKCFLTGSRNSILNLDLLPFPAYDLVASNIQYSKLVVVITSRGCPGTCIFCASGAYSGQKYRMQSAEWLFSLLYYYKFNLDAFNSVHFADDTFTVNKNRLKKFFFYTKQENWKYGWACKSRIDSLDEDTIQMLAAAGCLSMHIGVESGDQNILDSIDKKINLQKSFDIIALLNKHSIRPECSFMIGLPADTQETIDKTLIFVAEIEKNKLGFAIASIATPFPGTKMYNMATKFGMIFNTFDWRNYTTTSPVFYTDNFSIQDIRKAYYIYKADKKKLYGRNIISNSDLTEYRKAIQVWAKGVTAVKDSQNLQSVKE